jgi:hypothetical protein
MAQPPAEPNRSSYEEIPDEVNKLLRESNKEEGVVPTSKSTQSALLEQHERQLGLQASGTLPSRTFVLPLPYPPSRTSVPEANQVHIDEILVNSRKSNEVLLLRAITEPYVYSSSIIIAEDEHGAVARLTLCNLEDSPIDPVLSQGAILAVKQPCWSATPDGGYHIRVDHPTDLVLLEPSHETVPPAWRQTEQIRGSKALSEFKKQGDMMFLQKKFRKALK